MPEFSLLQQIFFDVRGDHRVITARRIPWPAAENVTDHKRQCVIFVFTVLHIFSLLSLKLNLYIFGCHCAK